MAHRSGLTQRLPLSRLRILDGHNESLIAMLKEMLTPDVEVAIRLGAWGYARGLVVQVFDPAGATVAFGRVGIDAHGRDAVNAERRNLARVAELDLRHVVHPSVLDGRDWRGMSVLLLTPLLTSRSPTADTGPPVEAMLELANAGANGVVALPTSQWWSSVGDRLGRVTDARLRDDLDVARHILEAGSGRARLRLGPWHGDWTAWNMTWDGHQVLLWDWEHFAEEVPVGFDLLHYLAQQARVSTGTDRAAEEEWRAQAAQSLSQHVGLDAPARDLVILAYLLEVNLRFVLDRQGTTDSGSARSGWGLDLLLHESKRVAAS